MLRLIYIFCVCFPLFTFADSTGVIRVVKGDVKIRPAKTGILVPAKVDQNVVVKDTIITGADGWATIIMDDLSAFKVAPNSTLEIRKYISSLSQNQSETLLHLAQGRARFLVQKKPDFKKNFEVHTPTSICGVRGTDFLVEYTAERESSKVTTFDGVVEFGQRSPDERMINPVKVSAGMTSTHEKKERVENPRKLSNDDLKKAKDAFGDLGEEHPRKERRERNRGRRR